jgi:two-component system chemotaxis response regulator CheB
LVPRHDLVVVGGSAGGLQALTTIVSQLPPSLEACVLVVMHSAAGTPSVLPEIIGRVATLPVSVAKTGDDLRPGRIVIAAPDCHLLVNGSGLIVAHGPRENGFRPAVDPLFRTAARQYGSRLVGVVLSGALSDGTFGLSVIKHYGGVAIVQDPDDAVIPGMPASAIRSVDVDHVLPAADIAKAIVRLCGAEGQQSVSGGNTMARRSPPRRQEEVPEPQRPSSELTEVSQMNGAFGAPSGLTCPDCGGALWEVAEGRAVRYQCHVGHQYAPENLDVSQRDLLDQALWSAVRVLEEQAELKTRMAARAAGGGVTQVAQRFEESARDAREQARHLRSVLFNLPTGAAANTVASASRNATPRRRNQAK